MDRKLWEPSVERVRNSNMTKYLEWLKQKKGLSFSSYDELHDWSVTERAAFWESIWDFGEVIHSQHHDNVVENQDDMLGSRWFKGAKLNFAENMLRYRDDRTALVFRSENPERETLSMTYAELYDNVARMAASLEDLGVRIGDRVVGFMPNRIEAVVAMLASISLGAIWSSCSPDFGFQGVIDRFGQIKPKVLFTADGYFYNGKSFDSLGQVTEILDELPSIEKVVVIPYVRERPDINGIPFSVHYQDFIAKESREMRFEQLPFDHPIYILYTSGTTGVPKCIVHGAGGTLLQHIKELKLHTDLGRDDRVFYFTTCGWMMWNWLVSSLCLGATVMLFDGAPFYPDSGTLWRFAEEEGMTVFGTSAKYLAALEKDGRKPGGEFDLSRLRSILSTGSPLSVDSFRYVYRDIKDDLQLSSISGGSDIISCFSLGNPNLPVMEGELQCRGLGMKVEVFDEEGIPTRGEKGELVCTASFPSQPIFFWNDEDRSKYRRAYFEIYPNIWRHGDYAEITDSGGIIIYGRSDATLNPGGVRIGTAEIYRPVEAFDEVEDSLVIGQKWNDDVRVILFLKLRKGVEMSSDLEVDIKNSIRRNSTPRHVPAKIIPIGDIPYTISGKKVELAVIRIIDGKDVPNRDALKNPESLELYLNIPELNEK